MTQHERMWQIQRQKETDARKRITEWFDEHLDKQRCSAYYALAGGHFINGIEKNERGNIQMRTDTGGLVDLMYFGADVLSAVSYSIEQ